MPADLHEIGVQGYALAYFLALGLVAAWESRAPRRSPQQPGPRWAKNVALSVIGVVLAHALLPAVGIGFAFYAAERGWGLFRHVELPYALVFLASLVAMDFARWLQHYLLHRIPWLFRLHAVHHTDIEFDFSTGLRFHPLEAVYTTAVTAGVIGALGAPVAAVIVYEIVNVIFSVFAHGNLALPARVDRALRRFVLTPDLHRIHHSVVEAEQSTNFAVVTPVWDRLLGTYCDQPERGHEGIRFGLSGHDDAFGQTFLGLLVTPFRRARRSLERLRGEARPAA